MEIEQYQIKFEYIKGIKNTSADTMSRLITIDPSSDGYHYALTVICMLTGYMFCIRLMTKAASKVVQAHIAEVYVKFRGSMKILSDNGTEIKNQLFMDVATQLGVECRVFLSPSPIQWKN